MTAYLFSRSILRKESDNAEQKGGAMLAPGPRVSAQLGAGPSAHVDGDRI